MLGTKLLMVFGVSGIGKTTACVEYARLHENVVHFSASKLLGLDRSSAGERSANEMLQDQRKLVELVRAARASTSARLMLLDAHSVVIVGGRQLIVPTDVIGAMEPDGFIFLEAAAEAVSRRRLARGDQGAHVSDIESVQRAQTAALRAVEGYSETLGCALSIVRADQPVDLADEIEKLL